MTGPIDANIQAYIDKAVEKKFFGMESSNLQDDIDDLKSRIESIELSGLQEQISNLSDRVAAQGQMLLEARRSNSLLMLDMLQAELLMAMVQIGGSNQPQTAREYLVSSCAATKSALKVSENPKLMSKAPMLDGESS